jgi:group I intron endonuclease
MNLAVNNIVSVPALLLYKDGKAVVSSDLPFLATCRRGTSGMVDSTVERPVFVYKIKCLVNGKEYVGITCRLKRRKKEHLLWGRSRDSRGIRGAIKKYGPDNFVFEVLHEAPTADDARTMERQLIAEYRTMVPNGYNLTTGGESGGPGIKVSDEVKRHLSKTGKTLWANPAYRTMMVAALQNKVLPESHMEHLRRQAALMKGIPRSRDSVEKGRAKLIGHEVSQETRDKISVSRKGKRLWTQDMKDDHSAMLKVQRDTGVYNYRGPDKKKRKRRTRAEIAAQASLFGNVL